VHLPLVFSSDKPQMNSEKALLRTMMRQRLKTSTATERETASTTLRELARSLPRWESARVIGLFYPLPQEPDLLDLLSEKSKRFVFPCVNETGLAWRAASDTSDFESRISIGNNRLLEPRATENVELREVDLLFVPGMAFTTKGERLGRGGGYYDRALSLLRADAESVGVCFQFQLVDVIPMEPHDLRVGRVLYPEIPS
jgi:5-formyltetrahydrofolate cyclo-ligase